MNTTLSSKAERHVRNMSTMSGRQAGHVLHFIRRILAGVLAGVLLLTPAGLDAATHSRDVYVDGFKGTWLDGSWGCTTNDSMTAPGASGHKCIGATINGGWNAFWIIDNWGNNPENNYYLNAYTKIEFDLYIYSDSKNLDKLHFVLQEGGSADQPLLTSLIANWSGKSDANGFNNWHHVSVDLASLNPKIESFNGFWLWDVGSSSGGQHFCVNNVRLVYEDDTTPPVITFDGATGDYDLLSLSFHTNEAANCSVEYGMGNYAKSAAESTGVWTTKHNIVLAGLTPGATVQFRITAKDHPAAAGATPNSSTYTGSAVLTEAAEPTAATVTIHADTAKQHAISPWIYGVNFLQQWPSTLRNLTMNRMGGNRWTCYNWENNASNAGSDWYYNNDNYLSSSTVPAEAVRSVVAGDRTRGNGSLITVQLQGYVAADENGQVSLSDADHLVKRFKQVVYKKGSAFTLTPSTGDAYVYMDEFLWALRQKIGTDIYHDPDMPTLVNLDNEPDIWSSTHEEVQATAPTVADYDAKTVALCKALKDLDSGIVLIGPVNYGFNGMVSFQGQDGFDGDYWFVDKYLQDMRAASASYGKRLLDVYDFHWYSENYVDSDRVTSLNGSELTDEQTQGIVQTPRSFWDPSFTENSWIAQYLGGPVRILARMQEKIDANYPGTGLAISEYNNGGEGSIAGTIAQADTLGVFGQMGVFEASYWPMTDDTSRIEAAFNAFRDYDGALSAFGDVSVPTESSDTSKVAAYVSLDSADANRCIIVAINRSSATQAVNFTGIARSGTARYFRVSSARKSPAAVGSGALDLARDIIALPAYSVTTVELTGGAASGTIDWAGCGESATAHWYASPWYGWFYRTTDTGDWIFSTTHGWQYIWPSSTRDDVYLYDLGTASWWWTSRSFWPWFYDFSAGAWCYFDHGTNPTRLFYSYAGGKYVQEADLPRGF